MHAHLVCASNLNVFPTHLVLLRVWPPIAELVLSHVLHRFSVTLSELC